MPNAVDMLIQDHNDANQLFEQCLQGGREAQTAWTKLAAALTAHVTVEKEIFYPKVRPEVGSEVADDLWTHQQEEETNGPRYINDLTRMGPAHKDFATKCKEFRDILVAHAQEEEQKLFPKVKDHMDPEQLEELGREMEQRRQQVMREARPASR